MITTSNYLLSATVGGEQYRFEYDAGDVWEALGEFWHEDYPETLMQRRDGDLFPIDVAAMDDGKVIASYELAFNASLFHYFYDHGRITLDEFASALRQDRLNMKVN